MPLWIDDIIRVSMFVGGLGLVIWSVIHWWHEYQKQIDEERS